jgi:hypothetical protein
MHGHKLTGDAAVDAVAVEQPQGMLYPLEEKEQYEALRGSCGEAIPQTAAALIPASMMAGSSSDSEGQVTEI